LETTAEVVSYSAQITLTIGNSPLGLGSRDGSANPFDGLIEEAAMWNARSDRPGAGRALYNLGAGVTYPF
jgi:hypothetical protein